LFKKHSTKRPHRGRKRGCQSSAVPNES
jgi:hypothetical protein